MRYGIDAKLFDWSDEITADCQRRQAREFERPVRRPVPGPVEGGAIAQIALQSTVLQKESAAIPFPTPLSAPQSARPGK